MYLNISSKGICCYCFSLKDFSSVSYCQRDAFLLRVTLLGQTYPTGLHTEVFPQLAVSSLLLPLSKPTFKTHL